jgi:transcriptional regulator with XRE-family HTH domain
MPSGPERIAARLAGQIGVAIRERRLARRWTLRQLAERSGRSAGFIHAVEEGDEASFSSYAAIAEALDLQPVFELVDPRRHGRAVASADPVHAAMGTALASRFTPFRYPVALDEPYQHYQFAGRADLVAWDLERAALLHVENRTRFPNIGETFGSYNAKRRYLPSALAERIGLERGFASVTNVIVALWSAEVIREVRRHEASFRAVCPHPVEEFGQWWLAHAPAQPGVSSCFVLFDPVEGGRSDRRRYVGLDDVATVRPRYRGYADAADALRRSGQA